MAYPYDEEQTLEVSTDDTGPQQLLQSQVRASGALGGGLGTLTDALLTHLAPDRVRRIMEERDSASKAVKEAYGAPRPQTSWAGDYMDTVLDPSSGQDSITRARAGTVAASRNQARQAQQAWADKIAGSQAILKNADTDETHLEKLAAKQAAASKGSGQRFKVQQYQGNVAILDMEKGGTPISSFQLGQDMEYSKLFQKHVDHLTKVGSFQNYDDLLAQAHMLAGADMEVMGKRPKGISGLTPGQPAPVGQASPVQELQMPRPAAQQEPVGPNGRPLSAPKRQVILQELSSLMDQREATQNPDMRSQINDRIAQLRQAATAEGFDPFRAEATPPTPAPQQQPRSPGLVMKDTVAQAAAMEAAKTKAKIEAERVANKPEDIARLNEAISGLQTFKDNVDTLGKHKGIDYAAGWKRKIPIVGADVLHVPETSGAGDFNVMLDQIKSGSLMQTLQQIKALSATGASGFGSLTEKEADRIIANFVAIDPQRQSPEHVRRELAKVAKQSAEAIEKLKRGFATKFSPAPPGTEPTTAPPTETQKPQTKVINGVTYVKKPGDTLWRKAN